MSSVPTIAISPSGLFPNESAMINQLFDAGLHRYHILKSAASEQSIAEILEGVTPKYLGRITLHSHFHLVLAYGVGGIHYSLDHRTTLGVDYPSKVSLYQSFGILVSTSVPSKTTEWVPVDYALLSTTEHELVQGAYPIQSYTETEVSNLFSEDPAPHQTSYDILLQQLTKK